MSSSVASSSSKSKSAWKYDFFITSNDPESRLKADLGIYLEEAGFTAFFDDPNQKTEFSVHETIQRCRFVLIIFTPEFLEADLFLKRVVNVMWCHKTLDKTPLPVFFGVSQEQVLENLGCKRSDYWNLDFDLASIRAITEAASLSGCTLLSDELGNGFDNLISKAISQEGLQLRVKEVLHLLKSNHMENTVIVGIWGVGGIGKTTIARAIFDGIGGNFVIKCFLENINDVWDKHDGRVLLRMENVLHKRAIVVLDDVNHVDQIKDLCGNRDNFHHGSLILITARNEDLLSPFADISYKMKKLDSSESLQLFSWYAFKKSRPPTNYFANLSRKVSALCEGIPLVLEVIGSLLYERTKLDWKKVLNKLKEVPDGGIQQKLKISLGFLSDSEKELFCDIACVYVGQSRHNVIQLLEGSKLSVRKGMRAIIERNLVKVVNGKIHVHDLLQEVGRGIGPIKRKLKYIYDVFLNFRGEDTRKSFTTNLYNALKQAGIKVFLDDEGIERGENISESLFHAIENSRISVIIFSQNYAGSSWCLRELEKIMECYKTTYQEVFPIFYNVQPSEVRKQQNAYGKAWERLIMRPSASKGNKLTINSKRALFEAANLSGWDMKNYGTEVELFDEVVKTITMRLDNSKYMFVANHPVGLESRVQDVIQFLSSDSNKTIIVGILGMGGVGKTTMAKAIYNEMGQSFAGKSFLADIREVWKKDNGQVCLQEQLLCSISTRRIKLPNAGIGKSLIKEILCQKRVFLVLDDVSSEDQLKVLCEGHEWFGHGSRIIITTRDERLLQIFQVDKVFNAREMDDHESIELFSWHAFKQAFPEENFIELSRKVVLYSRGLPLALEVLGSYLFERKMPYWESALNKLKRIPNGKIYEILKISYDGLNDQTEKELFLDICCFFIGKDRSYATQVLDDCGLDAEIGITHLIERSLVKVVKFGDKNMLDMHDLVRDMGREIIRAQSPEEPEKRTRLWSNGDVLDVLRKNTGTITIKGLSLNMSGNNSIFLSTKAFVNMKRLRLLNFDHVQLKGDYGYLSQELRWLCWHGFLLENLPIDFNLEKIVAIDLKWSNLTKVWEESQVLEWLKILNLSHSHYLTETPDFSKLPYLEKLILKDCPRLSVIHSSIGDLRHIILLNLKDCSGLEHLPKSIYDLKSLKTLNLSGCSKIERLDEDIEKMESLTILVANQTAIAQIPIALTRIRNLKYVSLCGHEGLSHDVLRSLMLSWMPPTYHSKSWFQALGIMPSLVKCLSHPLFARSREMFQAIPRTSQASRKKTAALIGFHELAVHMPSSETFMNSITIHVGKFNNVIDIFLKNISQGCSERGFGVDSLPGDNYPHWLNFKGEGSSIIFEVPQTIGKSLKGLILCVIYLSSHQDNMTSVYPIGVLVSNHTKATMKLYQKDATGTSKDEDNWQNIISNLEPGNKVEVIVTFACELKVKNVAIYLVYDEDI